MEGRGGVGESGGKGGGKEGGGAGWLAAALVACRLAWLSAGLGGRELAWLGGGLRLGLRVGVCGAAAPQSSSLSSAPSMLDCCRAPPETAPRLSLLRRASAAAASFQ